MAFFYILAGVNHFVNPEFYIHIMPPYLPWPHSLVAVSGVCEIVFGVMLMFGATRKTGALAIIAMLIAFYPVHVHMAIDYWQQSRPYLWLVILRLPLQMVLIWWAYLYTEN